MAIARNWLDDVVAALLERMKKTASGTAVTFDALHVREVLAAGLPMKPDVAYMEVPRCDSCRWWHGPQAFADGHEQCTEPTISPEQNEEFMTKADFGCVRWARA